MKPLYYLLTIGTIISASSSTVLAQNPSRTITVSGSSEYSLSPNEIIINIVFQEYFIDDIEKMENKITIESIEKTVLESLEKSAIAEDKITVGAVQVIRPYRNRIYHKPRLSKSLLVCINNTQDFTLLTRTLESDELFDKAITNYSIVEYRHTEKESYMTKSRSQAYSDALEKGRLILSHSGEKLGKVIRIEEINRRNATSSSDSFYSTDNSSSASGFKPIMISYDLMITFEIE